MIYIKHRVNKISELAGVDKNHGVEIDLRTGVSANGAIHLSHDPWMHGDDFVPWLDEFKKQKISGPIILNTKEDGLESRCLDLMAQYQISNFFFLDTTVPTLVKWALKQNEKRFAVRLSSVEPSESIAAFQGKVNWLWVDCFDGKAMDTAKVGALKGKFKICLVSPELQGADSSMIASFKGLHAIADAVCTKVPDVWEKM
jgi:hypothetical protein